MSTLTVSRRTRRPRQELVFGGCMWAVATACAVAAAFIFATIAR